MVNTLMLQIGGARALLANPDDLRCPKCGRQIEPLPMSWPVGDGKNPGAELEIWPVYLCDDCVREREEMGKPTTDKLAAVGLFGINRSMTFANFKAKSQLLARAKRKALDFAANPDGNLWAYGGCGTGKTHLAASVAREVGDRHLRAVFAEVPCLLDQLTEDYLSHESPVLKESRWAVCDLLVLDDLGMEKLTEHRLERLTMVVNERTKFKRPTIVTSNYHPEELANKLPDRLLSRLMADCTLINTGSEDWRLRRRSSQDRTHG
jgi:DNA replication protein DnaC